MTAPHFVAGIVLGDDRSVVEAAPILRYMVGWPREKARDYCRRKGWKTEKVNPA